MEYLNIHGDVSVPAAIRETLMEHLTELNGDMKVIKGTLISGKLSVRITAEMLEKAEKGICVEGCVNVTLDSDIPSEQILERLEIIGCVNVRCIPEQEGAVSLISTGVTNISSGKKEEASENSIFKNFLGSMGDLLDTKMVNTGEYVL